jgi:hypothetical protein
VTVFGQKPLNRFAALLSQKKKRREAPERPEGAKNSGTPAPQSPARAAAVGVKVKGGPPLGKKHKREDGAGTEQEARPTKRAATPSQQGEKEREVEVSRGQGGKKQKEGVEREACPKKGDALFLKKGAGGVEEEVTFLIMNQYVVPPWSNERAQAAIEVTKKLCKSLELLGNITIAKGGYNAKVSGGYEQVRKFTDELRFFDTLFMATDFKFVDGIKGGIQ